MELNPDRGFFPNGPGDPASMKSIVQEIKSLTEKMSRCLGHQILGQTFGGETYKLKFGHRGGNQRLKDLATRVVEITVNNYGFAIYAKTLPENIEVTHINLNNETVAGIQHKSLPILSVQFHPEAAPGPHDAEHHFKRFVKLMEEKKMAVAN